MLRWRGWAACAALLAVISGIRLLQPKDTRMPAVKMTVSGPSVTEFLPTSPAAAATDSMPGTEKKPCVFQASRVAPSVLPAEKPADRTEPGEIRKMQAGIQATVPLSYRLVSSASRRGFIPLTSKSALENRLAYDLLLAQSVSQQHENKKEQPRFACSGHIVPGYATGTYSSSLKNVRGDRYTSQQMDGLMNIGGGLKFSVSTGKKITLSTGLFYSRIGQKTTDPGQSRLVTRFAALEQEAVSTPLGNIKSRTQPIGYRTAGATLLNNLGNAGESIEQRFGTLEVPLFVQYRLNDNKIRFFIAGGFSGNFIVSNKVYLSHDSGKELLGSTESIRDFILSTNCSLGMAYPLGRKIKLLLEPGFKYYLQSLSKNENIDFKPYAFSLSAGIGIEF